MSRNVKRFNVGIVLVSVALLAALLGHVIIDVLGDFMLAHDTYDDVDHSSRGVVALVTLALACCGIGFGLRAAVSEAAGSEDAFCAALRSAIPRGIAAFTVLAILAATGIMCVMEGCDALLAGQSIDDLGDLFGGSVVFGGTIVSVTAACVSVIAVAALRRLSRARRIAVALVAFLRRCVAKVIIADSGSDLEHRLVFRSRVIARRVAGRAPPRALLVATS